MVNTDKNTSNDTINITVSVIMSVYNGEKYLREAVNSILSQTLREFEFIIINDGSTDRTRSILESYDDPRITLVNQANIGLTKSLNKAIGMAKSEFIARQDADDISLPERLEKQITYLKDNPDVALIGTSYVVINDKGKHIKKIMLLENDNDIKNAIVKGNPFCHGSVLFRKDVVNIIGNYDESYETAQDYDLWMRISEKCPVANLRDIYYMWRLHLNSVTIKKLEQQLMFRNKAIQHSINRNNGSFNDYDMNILNDKNKLDEEINNIIETWYIDLYNAHDYMGAIGLANTILKANLLNHKYYKLYIKCIIKTYTQIMITSLANKGS